MRSEVKKSFKTLDLFSLLFLVCIVFTISGVIISKELKDVHRSLAINEAENLAFQIVNGGFRGNFNELEEKSSSLRGPASLNDVKGRYYTSIGVFERQGKIGKDPWGQPYEYQVIAAEKELKASYIVVWSSGPNMKKETDIYGVMERKQNAEDIQFSGDDFGYVKKISAAGSSQPVAR